ncbi:MAG: phenylalanine--tRNA ligase subunit beta, partial [bacterium]
MKVSYKLIKKYIDCPLPPEALAQKLTMAGLEVGAVEKAGLDLNRCVVGQILEINPHPEADLLTVCQVDIGTGMLTIVCGARNMKAKDKVPVALVGCRLPGGPVIRKSKIRGVVSEGMMCSERELGLSEESSGLLILPPDAPIGMEVAQYLGLDDEVLDLDLTPNRGDCLSIRGITYEISAITGGRMKETTIAFPETGASMKDMVSIQVEAPDLCPRYAARLITGVTIGPSPMWLVQYLTSMGFRSINNVVDVTNFVMLEWGQPLHAFDYDLIQCRKIVVRRAREGEKLITLDGVERLLGGDNLVIADANRAIALAGVMGGANTEVSSQTHNILLESAFFNQISIRKTAKLFGLDSEASHRFERGIDPEGLIMAVNRAAQLILEVAGGNVAHGVIDVYPVPFQPGVVFLHLPLVRKYLGLEIPKERVSQILHDLGFSVDRIDEQKVKVQVPLRRWDIEREVDLIEEIARIFGYGNIPVHLPTGVISAEKKTRLRDIDLRLRNILVGLGFSEAINYSFISGRVLDALSEDTSSPMEKIYVKNPLAEDQNVMRDSLMVGLCQNLAYNQNRKAEDIRLFELGRCFTPSSYGL